MITREREDENICRQCGLNKEDDCACRCVECGANLWPSSRCEACELSRDRDAATREDMDDERREWNRESDQ